MARPLKKLKLKMGGEDSDSDESEELFGKGSPDTGFRINEEYAQRYEHNKKREELHQLEERYGQVTATGSKKPNRTEKSDELQSDSELSSSDEDEDDEGILVTDLLDAEISATLQAIKSKDPRVYDNSASFYSKVEEDDEPREKTREKPIYLKDYQREMLLRGDKPGEGDEDEIPPTYVKRQEDLKSGIMAEMNSAIQEDLHSIKLEKGDASDEEDGFFKAKEQAKVPGSTQSLEDPTAEVDDSLAEKDPDAFLSQFMSSRAWVPSTTARFVPFESDDEEEDERAENFEQAFNFRFEDPQATNEKLLSHSRTAAGKYSVRRDEPTGRRRAREVEQEKKEAGKQKQREERARLRKLKIEEAAEKLKKIKEAAGLRGTKLREEDWVGFLDEAWDDDRWEEMMDRRFGDEYYAEGEDGGQGPDREEEEHVSGHMEKGRRPKKPKWEDDIDIADIAPDFENGHLLMPFNVDSPERDLDETATQLNRDTRDGAIEGSHEVRRTRISKQDRLQNRQAKKATARQERRVIEALVDEKLDIDKTLLPASSTHRTQFRYRDTSPTTFGLTARDILMASDSQLNQYAGLKKLATFRPADKKRKDKKRLGKKARLRQWRKDTFGSEDVPELATEVGEGGPAIRSTAPHPPLPAADALVDVRAGKRKRKRSKRAALHQPDD
ncbi:MAG: KRRI-Interacting protein 1 [Phylliscum demangeonii]|nr:MAG: KRRI-Interacting protein 1 [Phylliscum demangeonii]